LVGLTVFRRRVVFIGPKVRQTSGRIAGTLAGKGVNLEWVAGLPGILDLAIKRA
jgi:hypothetical protein